MFRLLIHSHGCIVGASFRVFEEGRISFLLFLYQHLTWPTDLHFQYKTKKKNYTFSKKKSALSGLKGIVSIPFPPQHRSFCSETAVLLEFMIECERVSCQTQLVPNFYRRLLLDMDMLDHPRFIEQHSLQHEIAVV